MAWASSAPPASSSSAFWRSGGRARPRPPQHRHWPGQPREPAARPGRALRRRDHHQRALAIHEAQLSPDHPATAYSLNNLGTVLYGLGELSAARTTLERALAIREAQFGPDHPDTVMVRENLASVLVGSVRASSLPGSESQRHDPALVAHLAPTPPATAAWSPAPGSEVVGGQTSACSRVWPSRPAPRRRRGPPRPPSPAKSAPPPPPRLPASGSTPCAPDTRRTPSPTTGPTSRRLNEAVRCHRAVRHMTGVPRKSSKEIREAVSDRGRGVRSWGERPPTRASARRRGPRS